MLRYLVEARWKPGEWVAAEDAAVRGLRDRLKRRKRASLAERVALGQLVESALAARAPAVAARILASLAGVSERSAPCPASGDGGIVTVALHVARERAAEFELAVQELNRALLGRVDFHVHGPAEVLT
jgi:hypothetical protein